jgi:ketosteroid isomerase-like protein
VVALDGVTAEAERVADERTEPHALIEAEVRWTEAVRRCDRTEAGSFMTDDFTMLPAGPHEAPVGRTAWLAGVPMRSALDAFAYDDFRIHVIDDVALVQSRCRMRTHDSDTVTTACAFTDVWQRDGHRWRIGSRHAGWAQS